MAPLTQSCHFFSRYGVTLSAIFFLAGLGVEIFNINVVSGFELDEPWESSLVKVLATALFEPIGTGTAIYFIASRDSGTFDSVYDCFMKSWKPYSRLVVCYCFITGLVIFGFSLYFLPGIYFFYKLIFAEYIVVLEEKSPGEAIVSSFSQTSGQNQLILLSFIIIFVMLLGGGWLIEVVVGSLGSTDSIRFLGVAVKAPLIAFTTLTCFRLYSLSQGKALKSGI